jgi:hypothetical protein
MKNPYPLILLIFLTACGAVTEVPLLTLTQTPISSNTPRVTFTPTATPTFPPEIIRVYDFRTKMANVCPTTTPSTTMQPSVLGGNDLTREFAGNYIINTGYETIILVINCNNTFLGQYTSHMRWWDYGEGTYFIQADQIHLISRPEDDGYFNRVLIPVRWGLRKYLIELDRVDSFCEATVSTKFYKEPGDMPRLFYLRRGDEEIIATGDPILPSGEKVCP